MGQVGGAEHGGSSGLDGFGPPVVDVGRHLQTDTGIAMFVVVPAKERLAVHPGRLDRGEAGGKVGPVLQRLELGLGVRVDARNPEVTTLLLASTLRLGLHSSRSRPSTRKPPS